MMENQKITLLISPDLLKKAMATTGEGITPTIRRGLEILAAQKAYQKLRNLRGKTKFSINFKSLRED